MCELCNLNNIDDDDFEYKKKIYYLGYSELSNKYVLSCDQHIINTLNNYNDLIFQKTDKTMNCYMCNKCTNRFVNYRDNILCYMCFRNVMYNNIFKLEYLKQYCIYCDNYAPCSIGYVPSKIYHDKICMHHDLQKQINKKINDKFENIQSITKPYIPLHNIFIKHDISKKNQLFVNSDIFETILEFLDTDIIISLIHVSKNFYSNVIGHMPKIYKWNIDSNEYINQNDIEYQSYFNFLYSHYDLASQKFIKFVRDNPTKKRMYIKYDNTQDIDIIFSNMGHLDDLNYDFDFGISGLI